MTESRSIVTLSEVEGRLRYLASTEKSQRRLTMNEFHELERAQSPGSGPSTSEDVGPLTPRRTTRVRLKTHRDPEVQL